MRPGALAGLPYVQKSQTFRSVSGDAGCYLEIFVLKICIVSPAFVGSSVHLRSTEAFLAASDMLCIYQNKYYMTCMQ